MVFSEISLIGVDHFASLPSTYESRLFPYSFVDRVHCQALECQSGGEKWYLSLVSILISHE